MNEKKMFQIKPLQELNQIDQLYMPKIQENSHSSNHNHKNKNYFTIKTKLSPPDKISKYISTNKVTIKPHKKPKVFNTNTYNFSLSSNTTSKTLEENPKKKKEIIFPKIKTALGEQYNLSDIYLSNSKISSKPYLFNDMASLRQNKKPNDLSIKINEENSYNLMDEEYNNGKNCNKKSIFNHQNRSTKNSKMKIIQKEKSQEGLKKRLFLHSIELKRNHISNFYPDINIKYINNMNENKEAIKKKYNNFNFYNSKNIINKNNSINISNNNNGNNNNNTNIIPTKRSKIMILKKKKNDKKVYNIKKEVINNDEVSKDELNKDLLNLNNLYNSLTSLTKDDNYLYNIGESKEPVQLSQEIFHNYYSHFKPSSYSSEFEFKKDDFIKAYAYNTSEGNIRDYNEDTITATKLKLNPKDRNSYCYFFAVYDGHGGSGCSYYLKNHLHNNLNDFSVRGIKNAINHTEINFMEDKAVNNYGELVDTSGSCACIVLLENKKCIIANIGDSRCVIFKNKKVVFTTTDHKPNSNVEKRRIESSGGSIYQTNSVIPLYQNGKLIKAPWRVLPGRLSVSRTLGDIEAKDEKFGGKKNVVIALPDITELELNDEYNFIVIGCDGIFDVLSNIEILECIKIVIKINKNKNKKMNELCGDFAAMIIKSALEKESFDNLSCIVIVFNINELT